MAACIAGVGASGVARGRIGVDLLAYARCEPTQTDGADAEVACGKDRVSLEVRGDRTLLLGPFGEVQLAPYPLTIAKAKRETRDAWVDC